MAVVKKGDYKDENQLTEVMTTISEECAAASISIIVLVIDDLEYMDCDYKKAREYFVNDNFFVKGSIHRFKGNTEIECIEDK